MPVIHEITDLTAPELDIYARLTQAQLRNRLEPEKGIFIAESPKVIGTALEGGYEPVAFLMERRHITGDAAPLLARCGGAGDRGSLPESVCPPGPGEETLQRHGAGADRLRRGHAAPG